MTRKIFNITYVKHIYLRKFERNLVFNEITISLCSLKEKKKFSHQIFNYQKTSGTFLTEGVLSLEVLQTPRIKRCKVFSRITNLRISEYSIHLFTEITSKLVQKYPRDHHLDHNNKRKKGSCSVLFSEKMTSRPLSPCYRHTVVNSQPLWYYYYIHFTSVIPQLKTVQFQMSFQRRCRL